MGQASPFNASNVIYGSLGLGVDIEMARNIHGRDSENVPSGETFSAVQDLYNRLKPLVFERSYRGSANDNGGPRSYHGSRNSDDLWSYGASGRRSRDRRSDRRSRYDDSGSSSTRGSNRRSRYDDSGSSSNRGSNRRSRYDDSGSSSNRRLRSNGDRGSRNIDSDWRKR